MKVKENEAVFCSKKSQQPPLTLAPLSSLLGNAAMSTSMSFERFTMSETNVSIWAAC